MSIRSLETQVMNFLHNLTTIRFIFFSAFFILFSTYPSLPSHYQELGIPYIQTILPAYNHPVTYRSLIQDSQGFLYIGGKDGLSRYDGTFWKTINVKGPIQLAIDDNNQVYIGGNNVFGIITSDEGGFLKFENLLDTVEGRTNRLPGEIHKMVCLKDEVLICGTNGIFRWRGGKFIQVMDKLPVSGLYLVDQTVYIQSPQNGLQLYAAGNIHNIPGGRDLMMQAVIDILPYEDSLLIKLNNQKGFIRFFDGKMKDVHTRVDDLIEKYHYASGLKLNNGYYAIATKTGGIFIIDRRGDMVFHLDKTSGLYDNQVFQIFNDADCNLWVLHDNALSRIEFPSNFTYFDHNTGIGSKVHRIIRHNQKVFVAANNGLFLLKERCDIPGTSPLMFNTFVQVPGMDYPCITLLSYGTSLLVGTDRGIFEMNESGITKIFNGSVSILHQSKSDTNIIYAAHDNVITALKPQSSEWIILGQTVLNKMSVSSLCETPGGSLWIGTISHGILKLNTQEGLYTKSNIQKYYTEHGLPDGAERIKLYPVNNFLLCSTSKGLYYYDTDRDLFYPDTLFSQFSGSDPFQISSLSVSSENRIWVGLHLAEKNQNKIFYADIINGSYQFHPITFRRFDNHIISYIYPDDNNIIWLCTSDKLIRMNALMQEFCNPVFSSLIYKVTISTDSIIPREMLESGFIGKIRSPLHLNVPHKENRIRFDYLSIDYNSENQRLFQYFLDGFDEQWSDWETNSFIEYTSLPRGKYVFQVRSQDIFGTASTISSFQFSIQPPFYSSWWAYLTYGIILLTTLYFFQKWRTFQHLSEKYKLEEIIQERTEALIKEKEKTDNLLANILPKKTADELKSKGKASTSKFKMVTVLFGDIQGFTKIAEQMNPDKLIDELDQFYFHFDSVVEKYNIEKIKTIGDAYMAAGGIPVKNRTNPVEVILAALEMQHYMKELKKTKTDIWDLRIGIHTGSVIAGVVGQKKFSYDIWGDTVNTASRMESSGEPGKVNISSTTHELVKDFFDCEYRGKMPVKYKGDIDMYFVKGLKAELAGEDEIQGNQKFYTQIQFLRLLDLEEFIFQKLTNELNEDLFYHNVNHTSHVYTQVELLGRSENVSDEDILLLQTAALLHDIGYLVTIQDHEARSVEMAREILPLYRFNEDQIEQISNLIMATQIPPKPKNLLEKIICDANLDHLGRVDFLILSDKLFQEYRTQNKFKSKKEWNEFQIEFIRNHEFFTPAAKKLREVSKEQQIQYIRQYS